MRIRKRKDGRWEKRYIGSYHPDGKPQYKSIYATSYAEVKNKYKLLLNGNTKKEPATILSVERLCILWLEDIKITVKESTYSNYYGMIHNHIIPYFKDMKTKQLTNDKINSFIKEKTLNGRLDGNGGLSPKTVNDMTAVLKEIIQYGIDNDYLSGITTAFKKPKTTVKTLSVLSSPGSTPMI